mgnify:CR=1 FL=1
MKHRDPKTDDVYMISDRMSLLYRTSKGTRKNCPFMEQVIKERAQPQYPTRRDAQTELDIKVSVEGQP